MSPASRYTKAYCRENYFIYFIYTFWNGRNPSLSHLTDRPRIYTRVKATKSTNKHKTKLLTIGVTPSSNSYARKKTPSSKTQVSSFLILVINLASLLWWEWAGAGDRPSLDKYFCPLTWCERNPAVDTYTSITISFWNFTCYFDRHYTPT